MATSPLPIIILTLSLLAATISASAAADRNITDVLKDYPEYSLYNNYLTQTKLADEINRRETVTVLVFNNTIASEYLSNQTLAVIKVALSIHSLLDFFDLPKLHEIGGGNMTTTTLYQTTGTATGSTGFVKVTDLVAGNVGFGSGEGSRLDALFYRSVIQIPYNLSVLEITSPIITPGVLKRPLALDLNITSLLEKAGCKTFAKLISETGALKIYETAEARGLTVFAPSDEAFKARGLPDLSDLSNNDFISLLLYHAISGYVPKVSLMTEKNPIKTLASNQILSLGFTVRTVGDSVTLSTGVDDSRVESTILDSVPLSILKIDRVLLPAEFLPKSPARAPVPVPELSPPTPSSLSAPETSPPSPTVPETSPPSPPVPAPAPVKTPIALSPAPVSKASPVVSPPAPTTTSPVSGPAPADGPTSDAAINNSGSGIKAPVMLLALVIVTVFGIISSIVG